MYITSYILIKCHYPSQIVHFGQFNTFTVDTIFYVFYKVFEKKNTLIIGKKYYTNKYTKSQIEN